MEMRDNAAAQQADDRTLETTPVEGAIISEDNQPSEVIVDDRQTDPEAAAEQEMTEGILETEDGNETGCPGTVTRDTLLETARALEQKSDDELSGDEIRRLRQQYHAIQKAASEETSAEETADEILDILNALRQRKLDYAARQEAIRADNLARKNAIIDEINALAVDMDNVNRTFPRYRELQDEFNAIGEVAPTEETSVWKRFQEAREHYSDNLKINKELRDYDFKKNLDSKQLLLNEAEGLISEEDVIIAYRRLQELHNKWRQIGPVAKEIREEIWDKFKNASAEINKRYQAFFEAKKAREAENEAGKTSLCEKIEALDLNALKTSAAWQEATKLVIETQAEWKKFGYASRKLNNQLFSRFRQVCDKFFEQKASFFKSVHDELGKNLEAKIAIADRAEEIKDSTEWRKTTDEFIELQNKWKSIGMTIKKQSDPVWRRFNEASRYFFDQKKKAHAGIRKSEQENLKAKREIIDSLGQITAETPRQEAVAKLRELQAAWQKIGHVPFAEKNKINDEYRSKTNALFDSLNLRENRSRMERFENSVAEIESDSQKLYRERERLLRTAEAKRNELRTYENNLGFLSSSSKSGDSMLKDFQRKIERIKSDLAMLDEKVRLIDSKL